MSSTVIAQYLTIAGATVEVTEAQFNVTGTSVTAIAKAACGGCRTGHTSRDTFDSCYDDHLVPRARVVRNCSSWAQSHAETCRALP